MTVDDTRDRIATAAVKVAARRRRGRLSVVEVCEEAGVSRGTFYRHFSGPEDVFPAMASAVATVVLADIDRALRRLNRPATRNPAQTVADVLARVFVDDTPVGELFRGRPLFALDLAAAATPEIAMGLAAHLCHHNRRDRCRCIDDGAAMVRLASSVALAPLPGDGQLLRRIASVWSDEAGSGVPSARAS